MASPNDAELLQLIADPTTREQGFRLLMQQYQRRVYGLVRKMVSDHDDADDIMQETFIKIWQGLEHYRGDAQLFTWIYRIASNECLSFIARKKRKGHVPLEAAPEAAETAAARGPGPSGEEVSLRLQQAVDLLPEKQKLVFHLRYFDELTYEQMAEITGTSEGALKASYHHAVRKIEDFINRSETSL